MSEVRSEKHYSRPLLTKQDIDIANAVHTIRLKQIIAKHGNGSFSSKHEILGVVSEEFRELEEAVHSGTSRDIREELLDLSSVCVFAVACIDEQKIEW